MRHFLAAPACFAPTETSLPRISLATWLNLCMDLVRNINTVVMLRRRAVREPVLRCVNAHLASVVLSHAPTLLAMHFEFADPGRLSPPLLLPTPSLYLAGSRHRGIAQVWSAGRRHPLPRRPLQLLRCLPLWQHTPHLPW